MQAQRPRLATSYREALRSQSPPASVTVTSARKLARTTTRIDTLEFPVDRQSRQMRRTVARLYMTWVLEHQRCGYREKCARSPGLTPSPPPPTTSSPSAST